MMNTINAYDVWGNVIFDKNIIYLQNLKPKRASKMFAKDIFFVLWDGLQKKGA